MRVRNPPRGRSACAVIRPCRVVGQRRSRPLAERHHQGDRLGYAQNQSWDWLCL